jgi:hypothetical protein
MFREHFRPVFCLYKRDCNISRGLAVHYARVLIRRKGES